jgi:hypothetical protein
LVVPSTIVPLSDCWIFYRFPIGMFDLSTELTGCIFGNTLRILYNRVKIIYSNEFFIKYDYPYILTPYVGGTMFGVKIGTDAL